MAEETIENGVRKATGGVIIWGLLVILAGILCVMAPFVTTASIVLLIAIGLAVSGVSALVSAFRDSGAGRKFLDLLLGLFSLLTAVLLLANPFAGAVSLGLLLTILLAARGIAGILLGFQAPVGRMWILLGALIDLVLAYLLYSLGPVGAASTVGLYVGLSMIVWGITIVVTGSRVRSLLS